MNPESFIAWKILAESLDNLGRKEEAEEARERYKEVEFKLRKAGTKIVGKL